MILQFLALKTSFTLLSAPIRFSLPEQRLPCSSSSYMITFYFEEGTFITIRTSGTEPKIKYYSEIVSKPGET